VASSSDAPYSQVTGPELAQPIYPPFQMLANPMAFLKRVVCGMSLGETGGHFDPTLIIYPTLKKNQSVR